MARTMTVAHYISLQIEASGKSVAEVARELGYDKPNFVSMVRTGTSKLPINRVADFARVLGVDPAYLLRLVMHEYSPATWDAIEAIRGHAAVTQNELGILKELRRLSADSDPKMQTKTQRQALAAFVESMMGR